MDIKSSRIRLKLIFFIIRLLIHYSRKRCGVYFMYSLGNLQIVNKHLLMAVYYTLTPLVQLALNS